MIFIFEDDGNDLLSQLFRKAYPKDISNEFKYLKGISNAKDKIENIMKETSESITLFMDLVPDNLDLRSKYNTLRLISRRNNFRLIIIPTLCMEFCFIKSLKDLNVLKDLEVINRCLNKQPYYDLIDKFEDKSPIKNFEKFCKAIIKEFCLQCISTDSRSEEYGRYYTSDCKCITCNKNISVALKANTFVSELPCFPANSYIESVNELTIDQAWEIHRKCINSLNEMITIFWEDLYSDKTKLCKKFIPIK